MLVASSSPRTIVTNIQVARVDDYIAEIPPPPLHHFFLLRERRKTFRAHAFLCPNFILGDRLERIRKELNKTIDTSQNGRLIMFPR